MIDFDKLVYFLLWGKKLESKQNKNIQEQY